MFEKGKKVQYGLRKDVVATKICPAAIQIANNKQIPYINLYNIFTKNKHLFADGVHPNVKGCRLLAQEVYNAIKN